MKNSTHATQAMLVRLAHERGCQFDGYRSYAGKTAWGMPIHVVLVRDSAARKFYKVPFNSIKDALPTITWLKDHSIPYRKNLKLGKYDRSRHSLRRHRHTKN